MSQEKKCFIISPIGQENSIQRDHADQVFKYIIKPALEECNIEPIRSDHMHDAGKITEQMFNAIQNFDMCIAVLAFDNPNVYYELAVAQCAARPVIILIEKGNEIPFDLKDERVIYYDLTIPSYDEKIHINNVIKFIKNFEEINWKVPCSIPGFDDTNNTRGYQYFETAHKFGDDEIWKDIINDSESRLYLMGTALNAWRYTYTEGETFGDVLVKKAKEGCQIKILIMNPENDFLRQIHNEHIIPILHEEVSNTVRINLDFYSKYAKQSENIEFRQISTGRLTQNQAINDKYGIYIPHFYSIKSSNFPLWKFNEGSHLYDQLLKEFDGLWLLNDPKIKKIKGIIKEPLVELEGEVKKATEGISIYLSYSTKDTQLFKIQDIIIDLSKYPEIDNIFYWQENSEENRNFFLEDNLWRCDILLLFCSPNSLISADVENEWTVAEAMNKPILTIFSKVDYIPSLLSSRLGVEYDMHNYQKVIENIFNLILKKTSNYLQLQRNLITHDTPSDFKIKEDVSEFGESPFVAYEGNEPYLFVCYSHSDKKLVYPIMEDMHKKGVRIWYDEGIPAASNWIEKIADTIEDCNSLLVFITPRTFSSKHVRDEIMYASVKNKKIFVIYLEETELPLEIEFLIGRYQALFKHKMTQEIFWKKLKNQLTEVIQKPAH